jgi:hypothetical protein
VSSSFGVVGRVLQFVLKVVKGRKRHGHVHSRKFASQGASSFPVAFLSTSSISSRQPHHFLEDPPREQRLSHSPDFGALEEGHRFFGSGISALLQRLSISLFLVCAALDSLCHSSMPPFHTVLRCFHGPKASTSTVLQCICVCCFAHHPPLHSFGRSLQGVASVLYKLSPPNNVYYSHSLHWSLTVPNISHEHGAILQ